VFEVKNDGMVSTHNHVNETQNAHGIFVGRNDMKMWTRLKWQDVI